MASKKSRRTRSPRSRGLRTLQHQALSPRIRYAIDTEAWFRGLLLERRPPSDAERRWASKDQVHDEAMSWFLQQRAQQAMVDYPARRTGDEDTTFWVDSKIIERVRRLALREGVKVARLIDAALSAYVRQHVPEELLGFRQRVQEQAAGLYASLRGGAPPLARPRKGNS
jgi:hypothetical protein